MALNDFREGIFRTIQPGEYIFRGIVGVYQRHDFMDEMREAMSNWETRLTSLLKS